MIIGPLLAAAFAGVLTACSSSPNTGAPSKAFIEVPDWARFRAQTDKNLEFSKPIPPEELVDAAGSCGAMAAAPDAAPPPSVEATATAGSGTPAISPTDIPLGGGSAGLPIPGATGGVALGMSECEVVRRAGQPGGVNMSANEAGERTVVLTYLTGSWPGIYQFTSGRLKEISRAPEPPAPAKKPPPKKKAPAKPRPARS
jgi:hypothetical protein